MSWCKDFCLVCERETRVEAGKPVPYCSQACRLADYDKRDEQFICSGESNRFLTPAQSSKVASLGIPYTRPGTSDTYIFPSPPQSPTRMTRIRRISTSRSSTSSSTASSFGGRGPQNPQVSWIGIQRAGSVHQEHVYDSTYPEGLQELCDPLGRVVASFSPKGPDMTATSRMGNNAYSARGNGTGDIYERCRHLEYYSSFFDHSRRQNHNIRAGWPRDN